MAALDPTQGGFLDFIRTYMGIGTGALPDNSPAIPLAFTMAIEIVNLAIQCVSPLLYQQAVYNLAGSLLINIAPDQTGSTYFAEARKSFNMLSIVPGVIQSSGDEGTNQSMVVPDFFKNLTFANLQQLKDPWGRAYLAIAQDYGPTIWGVS